MYPYLKIIRPLNSFLAGISVFIAAFLSPAFRLSHVLFIAMLAAALVTAAGNVINDVYDLDIDRVNRPNRILPSAKMTVPRAKGYF